MKDCHLLAGVYSSQHHVPQWGFLSESSWTQIHPGFVCRTHLGHEKTQMVGRRFKLGWKSGLMGHLTQGCGWLRKLQTWQVFCTHWKPIKTKLGLLWHLCLSSAHSQQCSAAWVLTEKSLSSRILRVGGRQKEVASYKTQVRLVVAAVEEEWGFLTFLHWGARCKAASELHAWFRQSWLPSPATFLSCVLFSLI